MPGTIAPDAAAPGPAGRSAGRSRLLTLPNRSLCGSFPVTILHIDDRAVVRVPLATR